LSTPLSTRDNSNISNSTPSFNSNSNINSNVSSSANHGEDDSETDTDDEIDEYVHEFDVNASSNSNSIRASLPRLAKQRIYRPDDDMINYDFTVLCRSVATMSGLRQAHPPSGVDLRAYFTGFHFDARYIFDIPSLGAGFVHSRTGTLYLFDEERQLFCNIRRQPYLDYYEKEIDNPWEARGRDPCPASEGLVHPIPKTFAQVTPDIYDLAHFYVPPTSAPAPALPAQSYFGGMGPGYGSQYPIQNPFAGFGYGSSMGSGFQVYPVPMPITGGYGGAAQFPAQYPSSFQQIRSSTAGSAAFKFPAAAASSSSTQQVRARMP
jgi:hypothetical protein